MKALIMAAGVGSRISRHLQGQPKCCVDIDGKPLIRHTLELLRKRGIREVAIVTGYQERYIHQALEGLAYTRYFNPFFRITNSVSSAWFARNFLHGDDEIMIMNGDVFIEEQVLDILLKDTRSPMMLADSTRIDDADYRFTWHDMVLTNYGKSLTPEETTGEYVGIGRLDRTDLEVFRQRVIDAVSVETYDCWWEDIIYKASGEGESVYINDIAGNFWAEVDYIEDYQRIQKFVSQSS